MLHICLVSELLHSKNETSNVTFISLFSAFEALLLSLISVLLPISLADDTNQSFEVLFPFFLKSSNPKLEQRCQIPVWAFECLFKRLTAGSNLLHVGQNQKKHTY